MYRKIDAEQTAADREAEVLDFWKKNEIFEKSMAATAGGRAFSFYDGPPTANGKPHIGHILTRSIKDIIPRYRTMKGDHAVRKAGWDTHGLPVELEVEKQLGMDGKQDIERYGIEPFIDKCKESVWRYTDEWKRMSDRVGYWVDMEHPYVTYDDDYIESVWWSLAEIYRKGLIYKGHKIVPYCPRCGTALSSHEVAQGYKDVEETSVVAAFALVDAPDTYILAWTTTPWTLPSNVALCFHPDHEYACVRARGAKYILAKELVDNFFDEYELVSVMAGRAYEGTHYVPLYDVYHGPKDCYYAVCDEYVTLTDGTGVVHNAPAFGEDDAKVGRKYDLPFLQLVDERGNMTADAPFAGTFCKAADKLILGDLKSRGLCFREMKFTHSYPFCWRCDTPLLYYARSTWFIKMTAVRERLLASNASVHWIPESIGKGRMGNFLENVIDWGLSRDRYWGTPLPLWVCDDCGEIKAVGSKAELKEWGGLTEDVELHKPYVDAVTFRCPKCGGVMHRTPEVIDCWYDSGSMPFAQFHYPFENKELFESHFPADFISEAVDQTRGWFYTLLAISTLLFDRAPFKNCIVLGHVNDKNGVKMSKHKGNVVDPWSVLDRQGADAVRWYFYTNSSPWLPSRFYDEAVSEAQRKYLSTLWNTQSFYLLYAEIDRFDPTRYRLEECKLTTMDRWVLSELHSLASRVDEDLARYRITESARAIGEFGDRLSNWYVRRCRERYWTGEMDDDKIAAYMTLYTVLATLCRLTAPFTPFIAESIYQNVVRAVDAAAPLSVHLTTFPACDAAYIDKRLEDGMEVALRAVVLGRAARNLSGIKNRQPLPKMMICGEHADAIDGELVSIVADELNIKEVEVVTDAGDYVTYEVKPQLKTLGPRYGARLAKIRQHLADHAEEIVQAVSRVIVREDETGGEVSESGEYVADIDGEVRLTRDDLLISVKNREGFSAQSEGGITVILDTRLSAELVDEGYLREMISKVQTMRKEAGFAVTDRIRVRYSGDADIRRVMADRGGELAAAVLAEQLEEGADENARTWDVNGKAVALSVDKL